MTVYKALKPRLTDRSVENDPNWPSWPVGVLSKIEVLEPSGGQSCHISTIIREFYRSYQNSLTLAAVPMN